ncbi:MAG: DUF2508 family protein [Syntrophomonas sp.]
MWDWVKWLIGKGLNLMVIQEPEVDTRQYSLQVMLDEARGKLKCAHNRFDIADDPDLIDCAIFTLKAEEKRYDYILKQIKHYQKQASL